ncbi:MAG: DNA polymerase [Patescibacteria group bacterium]
MSPAKKKETKVVKQESRRLVLLDSHAILHRAYHALPDFSTARGEPTGALYGLSAMLISAIEGLKPDYIVACFDVKGPTYRHEAYKGYKAQRKETDDDLITQINRSYDIFKALDIPIYSKEGYEADDMLGTIVEQVRVQNEDKKKDSPRIDIVIASGDMDTLQLVKDKVVQVYTLKKGIKDTILYDEDLVRERFGFGPELIPDYKGLRGDTSDNIIGVKGIGEKTATILITTFGTIENMYKELEAGHEKKFLDAGITPRIVQLLKDNKEEAEFSKMLATINRKSPVEFVLPEKTFREGLDLKKVTALWTELEFRTLVQRLQKVIGSSVAAAEERDSEGAFGLSADEGERAAASADADGVPRANLLSSAAAPAATSLFNSAIDPKLLKETLLALWLVNSNLTNPTLEDLLNFGNTDDFAKARKTVYTELDKRNLRKVYEEIELPLISITDKMEERGIKVDKILLTDLSQKYHAEANRLQKEIWKLADMEFNISSPKQLGEVLFDKLGLTAKGMKKTAGGARSTKESELEKLVDLHPIVKLIFEYRELTKLLSTYIDAIPPLLDDKNRLHSHLVSAGSSTGRMASINPNLQNIPIKTELGKAIRHAFVSERGFRLCSFDYSQMELRIAAFLSGDEKMIEIFKGGEDVHASVASFVFKVPQDTVTSEMRRQAKAINFGMLYGMGVTSLQKSIGTDRPTAQKFYDDYFHTFSRLADYLNEVKAETARRGYTETFYGRRRYFEGIKSKIPYIRAQAERMAINAPIQGTEADVIKIAMIRIDEYLKKEGLQNDAHALLQVHDELVYEIKDEKAEEISKQIVKIMESVMSTEDTKGIVMKAEGAIGGTWGELK